MQAPPAAQSAHMAQGCKRQKAAGSMTVGAPHSAPIRNTHGCCGWMLTCAGGDVLWEGVVGSSYCPDPNKVASSWLQSCQGEVGAVLPHFQVPLWCRRAFLLHAEQVSVPLPRRGLPVHSQSPGSADRVCREGKRRQWDCGGEMVSEGTNLGCSRLALVWE